MKSLLGGFRPLASHNQLLQAQLQQWSRTCIRLQTRSLNTEVSNTTPETDAKALAESIKIPFQGIKHARLIPTTPSYFSREPRFNDLYISITKLLTKYHHLPTVPASEAAQIPWTKLEVIRAEMGERIKASHYAKVMRVAKRLHLIEPTCKPQEVIDAIKDFARDVDPLLNAPRPITIDRYGRAVGVGKRKESTARAFVVEGTGEVLINGKPLNKAFGRVHDRESAVWALTATERLDKYNVWALVEGGGTTGQAEALTLAVAKGLVAHEPALKPALRRAGCITRDPRTVERKHHGKLKARKGPTWVKR